MIAGSGVNLPLMRKLAATYAASHPTAKIEIPDSIGSSEAIKAIMDNGINLGLISRPLQEQEKAAGLKQIQVFFNDRLSFRLHFYPFGYLRRRTVRIGVIILPQNNIHLSSPPGVIQAFFYPLLVLIRLNRIHRMLQAAQNSPQIVIGNPHRHFFLAPLRHAAGTGTKH